MACFSVFYVFSLSVIQHNFDNVSVGKDGHA